MKKYFCFKFLFVFPFFFLFFLGCKEQTTLDEDLTFPVNYTTTYQMTLGTDLPLHLTKNQDIAEISLFIEDSLYQLWKTLDEDIHAKYDISLLGVGAKRFTLKAKDKQGKEYAEHQTLRILSDITPEQLHASVVTMYPHNPKDFTQGLEILNGILYESTGDPEHIGATKIMQKNLQTGEVIRETVLEGNYFGEGITILDNQLYQLTWTSQKCFLYDPISLETLSTSFSYTGEGWGLTNNGKEIIMSDGSERIFFRDPKTFRVIRTLSVYDNTGPLKNLNELEYVDGKIYANIWMVNKLAVIDPVSGKVLQMIDCEDFVRKGKGNGEVLNGIAFDKQQKKFFLTGKYWPYLAEVNF